ncbi:MULTISPECIES: ABC transporter permease [unclassified Halomonas]|uniref:ABC transporter permease n=1 Tax=unclassified Halomonas TaxID=2609666 RepID=UPI0028862BFD|nr:MULTISPECIES: ABC transporter permease [unclassified Halomonas]MDT0500004.1 ABC transporter permease [Halomonas sp. PAR7]MDT0512408.1 ABC transporter permease [Halomonas sp. LES1]MDT0591042.1 ABC transporter permease [Halomonas sp. PAR8]
MATPLATLLATLLSHYRRHPGQLAMLLLGLWVASALWSGVQAINASAKESYARAEALFTTRLDRLERLDGAPLTRDDYLALRRQGLPVSPLLEGELTAPDGTRLTLIGIDPLTLPGDSAFATANSTGELTGFLTPPWQTRIAPDTLPALGLALDEAPGATPTLGAGRLPPLFLAPSLPPHTLVMDIAAAARLLESGATLSRLVNAPGALEVAPAGLTLTRSTHLVSPGQLTQSFHLNLTALALLALIVGLFIVQAALGLALEQRLEMLRTLRALGVSGRALVAGLALELLLFGVIGALAGIAGGVWLARALLPDVAATLGSLYGAGVGVELRLPWHYWFGGLAVTLGGLLLAGTGVLWRAARLSVLDLGRAQAWRTGYQRQLWRMTLAGGVVALSGLGLWTWLSRQPAGEGLAAGFALMAAMLLLGALWLPPLLAAALAGLARLARRRPLAQWALADLQLQLPRLSLSLMALLIALSASLGVNSMVGGFRLTFLEWLDQRLVADLYLDPPAERFDAVHAWLGERAEVEERLATRQGESTLLAVSGDSGERPLEVPVSLFGLTPGKSLTPTWPLLETHQDVTAAWASLRDGAAFINEQLAIAEGLAPGDRLTLASSGGREILQVAAIYPDYGNPRGEVLMTADELGRRFAAPADSIGIVLTRGADAEALAAALGREFALGRDALRDQAEVKRIATGIFERTFTITRALNTLTLAVAALALLASLLAQARERRRRLAPMWALGVPRGRLLRVQLAQLGGAALAVGLVAVPLGIAITWGLVAVINVAAFGWRLPLHLFPGEIALTLATAVVVALLAATLPALRLWRTPPRALLAEEQAS